MNVQVLHSPILAALLHGTRGVAGRPSRWASGHILVFFCFFIGILVKGGTGALKV